MNTTEFGIAVTIGASFVIIILLFLIYREVVHNEQLSLTRTEEGRLQLP